MDSKMVKCILISEYYKDGEYVYSAGSDAYFAPGAKVNIRNEELIPQYYSQDGLDKVITLVDGVEVTSEEIVIPNRDLTVKHKIYRSSGLVVPFRVGSNRDIKYKVYSKTYNSAVVGIDFENSTDTGQITTWKLRLIEAGTENNGTPLQKTGSDGKAEFTGLKANQGYDVAIKWAPKRDDETYDWIRYRYNENEGFKTEKKPAGKKPKITIDSVTSCTLTTSITCPDYSFFKYGLMNSAGNAWIRDIDDCTPENKYSHKFTGLTPNTTYRVVVAYSNSTISSTFASTDKLSDEATWPAPTWSCSQSFDSLTPTISDVSTQNFSHFKYSIKAVNGTTPSCTGGSTTEYSTNKYHKFDNLNSNTEYYVSLSWSNTSVGVGDSQTKKYTTLRLVPKPVASNIGTSSVRITATDNKDYSYFKFAIKNSAGTEFIKDPTEPSNKVYADFDQLDPYTNYQAVVYYSAKKDGPFLAASDGFRTNPITPTWKISKIGAYSVTFKITKKGSFKYFRCVVEDENGDNEISSYPAGESYQQMSIDPVVTGLNPVTSYKAVLKWSSKSTEEDVKYRDEEKFTTIAVSPTWEVQNISRTSAEISVSSKGSYSHLRFSFKDSNGKEVASSGNSNQFVSNKTSFKTDKLKSDCDYTAVLEYSFSTTGANSKSDEEPFHTDPTPPSWSVENVGDSSATIKISSIKPGTYKYFKYWITDLNNNPVVTPKGYVEDKECSFSGLTPVTNYKAVLRWSHDKNDESFGGKACKDVAKFKTLFGKWDWSKSNGSYTSGNSSLTVTSKAALDNKDSPTAFKHQVWNDMLEKVKKLWELQEGKTYDDRVLQYESAKMTSTNNVLTASRFNSLRENIDLGLASKGLSARTGIDNVKKHDPVKASYFITFANRINDWVDKVNE